METGAETEHGRPDQNTNARKLSERKGSGGTVQSDMKKGELAPKKHGPSGKNRKTLDSKGRKGGLGATCSTL